ncbi:MAG: 50S ribosomal protein L17 [Bacteroidota bacterium]|nr:50S ribosomal protein L17 [Bacteroidota bacterium]
MIHGRAGRKLKRTASHRKATLSALSTALLRHKKIRTTVAKAKETRMVVERIITRAKRAVAKESEGAPKNVHARREVARFIHDKEVVKQLFTEIAPKVANRAGGYTRVVKLGQRLGDGADLAILELVDYNVAQEETKTPARPRRTRRPRKAGAGKPAETASERSAELVSETEQASVPKELPSPGQPDQPQVAKVSAGAEPPTEPAA